MSISFSQLLIYIVILGGPVLYPLIKKKWTWMITAIIGYAVYILWGVYLHFNADITEYGTGYGMFIIPYIIGITILGAFLQRNK